MKTISSKVWLKAGVAVCGLVLAATAVPRASADEHAAPVAKNEKCYTGTVTSIDPKERVLSVKDWTTFNKEFNLGANCACSQLDNNNATVDNLRPGEKVTVSYQNARGVLIADRIEQQPMRFEGMVKAIDNNQHTLTLHRMGLDKELQLPSDCKIMLHDGKSGTLADVQIGNQVTVTYETPDNAPTARQIKQTSIAFTGTLTAIDLDNKTLKANSAFAPKKFNLADNCAIVINGRTDGKLSDLKPNDRLVFSYDEINGVNVVNRIAPAETRPDSVATYAPGISPMTGY